MVFMRVRWTGILSCLLHYLVTNVVWDKLQIAPHDLLLHISLEAKWIDIYWKLEPFSYEQQHFLCLTHHIYSSSFYFKFLLYYPKGGTV